MSSISSPTLRKKVAREAANLLYVGVEKEYKQAKLKAARTSRVHFLPTNLEVAMELDRMAEEKEGTARRKRLVQMRKQALKLMKFLRIYNPVLIGSVWRGTARNGSDIDIYVYHEEPNDIIELIKQNNLKIVRTEWTKVTKEGRKKTYLHVYLTFPAKEKVEVIVRNPEEATCKERCEIYGDIITGLRIRELEKVLQENPAQRFVPF